MVRQKQDIAVLTHFWFDVFLQWSPAERNSFSLTMKWGWTASYHTIALNSVLSDGLIKTQYLLGIFVMTFTDVLHCSGRLVISIKTYIEQLESIYQQVSESLNYFFFCCTKRQWVQCLHTCCHSLERQDETSFFFVPVLVLWVFWDLLPTLNHRWYKNPDACTHRTKVCCLLAYAISFESLGGWLHLTVLIFDTV